MSGYKIISYLIIRLNVTFCVNNIHYYYFNKMKIEI